MARTWGLEGFRFLEMQHPIANLTPAQLDERAEAITYLEEIIDEWRLQTGELLRELNLDKPTITNHLPDDVMAEITREQAHFAARKRTRAKRSAAAKKAAGRGPGMGEMALSGFW